MPHHLLTVWNPAYADDALDAHLRVLLRWAERSRDPQDDATPDDVYVWWAKIRSPNRDQPLPHAAEIVALQEQIDAGEETHLYLTDYRSLYVWHLGEVTAEDVLADTPGEADHTPSYLNGNLLADRRRPGYINRSAPTRRGRHLGRETATCLLGRPGPTRGRTGY